MVLFVIGSQPFTSWRSLGQPVDQCQRRRDQRPDNPKPELAVATVPAGTARLASGLNRYAKLLCS
jgi:hypothetical protein